MTLLKSSVDVRIGQHRLLPWPLRRAAAGIPRRGRGCRGIRTCCYRGRPLYSGPSSSSSFLSTTLLCNMVGPCCCAMGPCCCARGPTCACPIRVLPGDTRPPRRILKGSRSSSVWLASSLMLFIWLTFDNRRSYSSYIFDIDGRGTIFLSSTNHTRLSQNRSRSPSVPIIYKIILIFIIHN